MTGQEPAKPFHWHGTMAEFDAEVARRWIESSQRLGLDSGMPNAEAALAAATPGRDLRAEVVHAEWTGWAEANGYANEHARDNGYTDMREAFTAGMGAQATLAAQLIVAAAQQPQAGLAAIRNSVAGLIGMWDGMRKVYTLADSEWEDWRAVLGRLVEELASNLDAIEETGTQQPQPAPVMTPAVTRPAFGSTLILAVGDAPDGSVRKLQDTLAAATEGEGVTVVTVRGVEALRTWEPQPAPGGTAYHDYVVRELNKLIDEAALLRDDLDKATRAMLDEGSNRMTAFATAIRNRNGLPS